MSTRAGVVALAVAALLTGCGGADDPEPVIEIATATPTAAVTDATATTGTGAGGAEVLRATTGDVALELDVTGEPDLVVQARQLQEVVAAGGDLSFATLRVDNDSGDPVTIDAVEVTTTGGERVTLEPAPPFIRELRSAVALYDTDTFEAATALLDTVEDQLSVAPGAASEQLLAAEEPLGEIAAAQVVGSMGRVELTAG